MATWLQFEREAPDLAQFGHELLHRHGPGLGFLATVRADGGPRVHPVCVLTEAGRLFVCVAHDSPKVGDLRRDPRYMLHAFPAEHDPEFSIRGRAGECEDPAIRAALAARFHFVRDGESLFELDIERADATTWVNWAQPGTYPVRKRWTAPGVQTGT